MIQVWLVTILYFLFSILILFLDDYRLELGFMLSVRHRLIVDKRVRLFFFALGLVLFALNLVMPMDPGPAVLGDFFPSLVCFFLSLYFLRYADEDRKTYLKLSDRTCASLLAGFTLVHFLVPGLVLV